MYSEGVYSFMLCTVYIRDWTLLALIFILLSATDLLLAWNPVCLGLVEGIIGKIQLHAGKSNIYCIKDDITILHCNVCNKYGDSWTKTDV